MTLVLLWQEYRAEQADGYGYSRFCDLYGEWRKTISATMRQTHPAGEKLFVDYAGDTVPVFDQITDAQRRAQRLLVQDLAGFGRRARGREVGRLQPRVGGYLRRDLLDVFH